MVRIILEDKKTKLEYKGIIKVVIKRFDYGSGVISYKKCFELRIYKPVFKVMWFKAYKKVKTSYRPVNEVDLASEYVKEIFKNYLKEIDSFRKEEEFFRLKEEKEKEEIRRKYDSLPNKITISE